MSEALDRFRAEYDPTHDLTFAGVRFRDGAAFSSSHDGTPIIFGLCEGFRQYSAGLQWGWIRYHIGTDRARGPVRAPFDAVNPGLEHDPTTRSVYGSLVRLPTAYGFEVRIAHMEPGKDFEPDSLACLLRHADIARGTKLGEAGCYGIGSGAHTHTEIVSIGPTAPVLDEILLAKHGPVVGREYTDDEVVSIYRMRERYMSATRDAILHDYQTERTSKGILWCNHFRATFWNDYYTGAPCTRYSSALLFGM